jgi:ligand-binding sensor domain-containing protein
MGWARLLFAVISLAVPAIVAAQPATETWKTFKQPGGFITALCATDDALWIGTEDNGLWRLDLKADPAKPDAWKQFIGKDGPNTEHVYGIAVDAAGRVWVGTVNQGVSVYNGREWRNYGVLDGCSGERVFAIAADPDPKRGNVWIGTDHGLVCWSPDTTERGVLPSPLAGEGAGCGQQPLTRPSATLSRRGRG